jgi:FxsC-like protein
MGRDFFLSYSSIDYKPGKKDDIQRFFKDLQERLTGLGLGGGGYFAARDNEAGVDWKDELVEHLESCHVLVPLYSPNYFKSPHCGREWTVYYDRFQKNKSDGVPQPDIILPALWTAELLELPEKVPEVQETTIAEYPDDYRNSGLSYLMQSGTRGKYGDFVRKFGLRLAKMIKAQGDYKLLPIPRYDLIDPYFPPDSRRGLTFVRYVFVAGTRTQMEGRRPNWDGYGTHVNRKDWKPCYPEEGREAGEIASALAASANKSFEFIEPSEKLLDRLRYAKELENIVVIVVDPWSLSVPSLKNLASVIDGEPLPNSALLVMWNNSGADTGGIPLLSVPGDPRFDTRESRKEYIVTVRAHDEFRKKLESFFNTFREVMIKDGKIRSAEESPGTAQAILKG